MAPPVNIKIPAHLKPSGIPQAKLLEIERSKASFSSKELALYIHGKAYLDEQKYLVDILSNDPAFDKSYRHYQGRTEKFRSALVKEKRLAQLILENGWSQETSAHAEFLADTPAQFGLHKSMYIATLRNMGTEEQRKAFLEPALRFETIGCYAQTELGHGSNVQGLETTATYDDETQEFVLHSPHLSSAKWWIGGLGRSADHAVVMAQLIVKGKRKGPHPFVVPIRDVKTRELLPGRIIGDIGSKMGYQTTDNGFMLLEHVRIPHFNMLAGLAQVDLQSAVYHPPQNAALNYGTLTFIRANIVREARTVLMRAATIAIRYCAVRRQFADRDAPKYGEDGKPIENQVLDYTLVQNRLFPVLAQAFAFHYTARFMFDLYNENMTNIQSGDLSLLADTHASSSGLKSLCTISAAWAIEGEQNRSFKFFELYADLNFLPKTECRRACGGHGFSLSSGLGHFYSDYLPNATWEGDSYMITGQTTRYLWKMMRQLKKEPEQAPKNVTTEYMARYLKNREATASIRFVGDLYDPIFFTRAFGHRAAYLVEKTLHLRDQARRSFNSLQVEIFNCSKAHSEYLVIRNFSMAILNDKELNSQPALRQIVQRLYLLYACKTMFDNAAEFMSSGFLSGEQYHLLQAKVQELLVEIRPQAVALVDGFALPDYLLDSALGNAEGNAYERLFDFAVREPINGRRWNVDIHDLETADFAPEGDAPPRDSKL